MGLRLYGSGFVRHTKQFLRLGRNEVGLWFGSRALKGGCAVILAPRFSEELVLGFGQVEARAIRAQKYGLELIVKCTRHGARLRGNGSCLTVSAFTVQSSGCCPH